MTCANCKSPDCTVQAANRAECDAWDGLVDDGGQANSEAYDAARLTLEQAQSDCAHRAAARTNGDTLARLADIEARQDRIEAVLRAKGWML